ncbi:hypothetical protein N657DRAFT_450784 [Parathielavia appendiculata]|uniref:Uncharacterized protein n=1 Tax=Parathielavia appendiculata TaxID=2587402 RepID=A0AAN6TZU5_9PEZI|nr:hypothetical protein N657DRAFT_450784 [Parathielavia appendiculata]
MLGKGSELRIPSESPRPSARQGETRRAATPVAKHTERASQHIRCAYETAPDGESTASEEMRPGYAGAPRRCRGLPRTCQRGTGRWKDRSASGGRQRYPIYTRKTIYALKPHCRPNRHHDAVLYQVRKLPLFTMRANPGQMYPYPLCQLYPVVFVPPPLQYV